ncbi:MAG: UDP-N-acetylmuramate--L-alanine ligase [Burkholderiales bacterium]|jgi:UDP-N-acetylmuramate--alanine ligase|nr:UDP-N-acetylmuramate--L-alanine ligase [Burkholderiales bacterium]
MKHKIKRIHFIGIGGVGMSGIAEVLHNLGYIVSGSDAITSSNTTRLKDMGITVCIGHKAGNVNGSDVIVSSTAIPASNPEIIAGNEQGITIVPRATMLAELMRFKYGIAIAGTHGKTTTTSLCAEVLSACSLDPTFIIGGKLAVTGTNAKLGGGDYLVAEADESDASFLYLNPLISVVTNIDLDHMDTYDHDENKLKQTFIDFLHRLPFYGCAILCNEDSRVKEIIPKISRRIVTYGLTNKSDIYATDIQSKSGKMCFNVCIKSSNTIYPITLNTPGIHNVLNSLAVIAVALECEGNMADIAKGLASFHGVGRRTQRYPDIMQGNKTAMLIDDYGHHPAELKVTISALKDAYPTSRMILLFQPHRYTRTRDLFDDFVKVLSEVDVLILLEVYSAGESLIPKADGKALANAIQLLRSDNIIFATDLSEAKKLLLNILENNDLVVTMGAGSIGKLPDMLIEN